MTPKEPTAPPSAFAARAIRSFDEQLIRAEKAEARVAELEAVWPCGHKSYRGLDGNNECVACSMIRAVDEQHEEIAELEAKLRDKDARILNLEATLDTSLKTLAEHIRAVHAIADRLAAALETTLSSWPSDYSDEPIERCRAALAAYDAARVKEPPAPREVVASLGISEALYRAKSGKEE